MEDAVSITFGAGKFGSIGQVPPSRLQGILTYWWSGKREKNRDGSSGSFHSSRPQPSPKTMPWEAVFLLVARRKRISMCQN